MDSSSNRTPFVSALALAMLVAIASTNALVAQVVGIDLGNIAAGGDGLAPPPAGNIGINADTGAFIQARINADVTEANLINPMPVDGLNGSSDSPFIDSVFIIDVGQGQVINLAGVPFDFDVGDVAQGWEGILNAWEPGGPDAINFGPTSFTNGVGIHAAQGITYDLLALRDAHGEENVRWFSAVMGEASGQANGFVNVYAILSDANGVIHSESALGMTDSGRFVQFEIPAEAEYLTLAVGAAGNGIGSDHGAFGAAQITAEEVEFEVVDVTLEIVPTYLSLIPGATRQLSVTRINNLGIRTDVASTATGTTYAVEPEGVISIDSNGFVTAEANGSAKITITHGEFSGEIAVLVADFVELGSIVAGGDGVEPPPAGNIGINADTGAFIQARLNGDVTEANGLNPMPVDGLDGSSDSPYIDSVFIMTTGIGQVINTAGVVFDFDAGDVAQGWEGILDGREPGGPDSLRFGPLGPYTSGLGIHAAQGITYDLDALRVRHGAERIRHFSALLGEAGDGVAPAGNVNAYVVLSSEEGVLKSATVRALTDEAVLVLLHIPEEAQYLTLATGAAGDGIGSDHGGFGLARLRGEPLEIASFSSLQITPPTVNLEIGESTALSVSAVSTETEGELAGATFRPDPSDVAFISSRPEVATVDERGVVQGVANGRATITATYRGQSVDVTVTVGLLLDLGEIVRGGDGTDSGLALGEGIDPRNGLFVIAGLDGAINETNPEADGVNPSPVVDSPFVDSVFFIGPAVDPLAATHPQAVTQSGVTFDFPTADATGTGWNFILAGRNGGASNPPMLVGGESFQRGIGIHSSAGITFDLDELRAEHGDEAVGTLSTFWGMDACASGDVILYAIFSNDDGVISSESQRALPGEGFLLEVPIPTNASYLTLATGSNGPDSCDHGSFAEAIILPGEGIDPPTDVFVRGDANASGDINLTDGIAILTYLFSNGAEPPCLDAADADDSGGLNLTDGIFVLSYLFSGGSPPPAPHPDCGGDPTDDNVTCVTSHASCL